MLSREDSRRLAELERQLRHDDPEFCARIEGAQPLVPSRRKRFPITLILTAAVLWTAAITLGVVVTLLLGVVPTFALNWAALGAFGS